MQDIESDFSKTYRMTATIAVNSGRVYLPRITGNKIEVFIYEHSAKETRNQCPFKQKVQYSKPLRSHSAKCIAIENVGNHVNNLNFVVLLVQYDVCKLTVLCCPESLKATELQELKSYTVLPSNNLICQVSVSDGPCIFVLESPKVRVLYPLKSISKVYDLTAFLLRPSKIPKILLSQCVEYKSLDNGFISLYIFFVHATKMTSDDANVSVFAVYWKSQGIFHEEFLPLPLDYFFPPRFQKKVSALNVSFENEKPYLQNVNAPEFRVDKVLWKSNSTIVCTNAPEVLVFCGGCQIRCFNLLFPNVYRIAAITSSASSELEKHLFIQSFPTGASHLLVKKGTSEIEYLQTWRNAHCVLPGDYFMNGSKQILVLYDESFDFWQDGCCIQELCNFAQSPSSQDTDIPDQHLSATVNGLMKRVTCGKAVIAKAHYEIGQKNAAIADVLSRISQKSQAVPANENVFKDSLLDIILAPDCTQHSCASVDKKQEPYALKIVSHWKIMLANEWVIGWTLLNVSKSSVVDCNVLIIMNGKDIEFKQKAFHDDWFKSSDKCSLDPGKKLSIAVVLKMPIFSSDCIELTCILSWCIGKVPADKIFQTSRQCLPCQQIAVHVPFLLSDVFQKKSTPECTEAELLMSYRVSQERLFLSVSASTSDLTFLSEGKLISQSTYQPTVKQFQNLKYFLFEDGHSPLYGVNMIPTKVSNLSIEMEIYVRNVADALLTVHWLYSILPHDVSISAKEFSDREISEVQTKLLLALKEEIDLLRALVTESTEAAKADLPDDNEIKRLDSDRVALSSIGFEQVKRALMKRKFSTDSLVSNLYSVYLTNNG